MTKKSIDDLKAAKQNVSQKYLGKYGIHGVGIRISEDCIFVLTSIPLERDVEEQMKKEVWAPHRLEIFFGQQPQYIA